MTDVLATTAELEALKKAAGIPHLPTQLTFEARLAIGGEGPRAYDWSDKPHRIVYDLCREIEKNANHVEQLERELSISRMAQVVMDNSVAEVERLQAQNMRMSGMVHDLKKEVAISDALLISEAEASLARLERAEKAEADNARLREAIETISYYNTVGYTDMALDAASAALKEETP